MHRPNPIRNSLEHLEGGRRCQARELRACFVQNSFCSLLFAICMWTLQRDQNESRSRVAWIDEDRFVRVARVDSHLEIEGTDAGRLQTDSNI